MSLSFIHRRDVEIYSVQLICWYFIVELISLELASKTLKVSLVHIIGDETGTSWF